MNEIEHKNNQKFSSDMRISVHSFFIGPLSNENWQKGYRFSGKKDKI